MLYEAVRFALAVAEASGGAFDPTVGQRMEARGFDRHHRTGVIASSDIAPGESVSWRDVRLDADAHDHAAEADRAGPRCRGERACR